MSRRFSTKALSFIERFAADPNDAEGQRLNKVIGVTLVMFGVLTYLGYGRTDAKLTFNVGPKPRTRVAGKRPSTLYSKLQMTASRRLNVP